MIWIILAISVGFGIARFVMPVRGLDFRDTFKDMAHLWVGFCFGYAASDGEWYFWAIPVALTVLEVVAFLVRRK